MGKFVVLDRSILDVVEKEGRKRDLSWMPEYEAFLQQLIDLDQPGSYEMDEGEKKNTVRNRIIQTAETKVNKWARFLRTTTSKEGKEVIRFVLEPLADKPAPVKRTRKPKTEVIDATAVPA